ncbi:uncharacterized protein STEHIDRAFT_137392 [Stereum hirsutum FP-91666 SS1]|uniref:uncharacterized protein n=1 Tax=Stereum hirsutum (strain FP-91666) TaxID=721885 RepID=UPI000440D857|nr:uncharacterized protein STEHIDRAFT_137392 [Stereum hirsutum FP-91666 SS1]EIM89698.1 hypothetical protein STEHIDRAFT_137392 [Stereum hirsutum FP-91666 SS1]
MSTSRFARPTSSARPQDNRRMAQYLPQLGALSMGLGLGLDFDSDTQFHTAASGAAAQYPQFRSLPRQLLTQEEVLGSQSMTSSHSNHLDAPFIQQCEFPAPFGAPLKMQRTLANHVPYGYGSGSEEDASTIGDLDMPHPQRTDYSSSDVIEHSPVQMRRTMATRRSPTEHGAAAYGSDDELHRSEPMMAGPVVGIAITDPKYRHIAMWAVEVERLAKHTVPEESDTDSLQPTGPLAKPSQGGWVRWTCLTR